MFKLPLEEESETETTRIIITAKDLDAFALEANTQHLNDEEMEILMELLRLARLGLKKRIRQDPCNPVLHED